MKYDLNKLNPTDFESIIQSLSKRILGNGAISFGEGTDGGREAVFTGSAPFPSETQNWNGYWVIQAKFKSVSVADENKDYKWVETQLKNELEKYRKRKTNVKHPDNYLLFTNIVLTAKAGTGGRDKASKLEEEYQTTYRIKNIRILSYDDIINYIDANRDLATAYSPFILPGDILAKLLNLLEVQSNRALRTKEILIRFLEYEFLEDMQAKLDHAGKLTSDKVSLENVFIDLYATIDGQFNKGRGDTKFVRSIIQKGNAIIKGNQSKSRCVLIAGPGYGKSTLSQFVIQIYRAFFIADTDKGRPTSETATHFIRSFYDSKEIEPKWIRLPIKIILKEFAGWIRDRTVDQVKLGTSVLEYIVFNMNRKSSGGDITTKELEDLLHNLPCIFVFDGLDEVPSSSNRSNVVSELSYFSETILRRIDADAIVIATTRPQGYSKEFDNSRFEHLYITDFEKSDCVMYLDRLLSKLIDDLDERNRKLQILTGALNNNEISRLMKSPLQASIMAILVKSGGNPPRDKFELFTNYYDIIFKREKQRGISVVLNERPEYVNEIHNRLGLFLQTVSEGSANPSATIRKADFVKMVNDYLTEIELEEENIISLTKEIVIAATDRLVFISEVEDEKFGFAIRSLQEYFAAHGYLHDVREAMIRDYIFAISKSSYWSNTLLFAVGYIAKTKSSYLIDSIESICNELNGSTNENSERSLTSIVKLGSWIALDIVNEGIFSGKPIIENKFCNLLEPLIYIQPSEKHKEISKLPVKIIEKWIKPLLEKAISTPSTNLTALTICSQLEKSGHNSTEIFSKYWPVEKHRELLFISSLAAAGINSNFVIARFLNRIENGEFESLLNLFDIEKYYEFINAACESNSNTPRSKNMLFELIFISSLSRDRSSGATSLLRKLGVALPGSTSRDLGGIVDNASDKLTVELVKGYSYEITKGKVQNNLITTLHKYADDRSIKLVSAICDFFGEPSNDRFEKLNAIICSLSETYKAFVISHVRTINSFFSTAYDETGRLLANWRQVLEEIEGSSLENLDLKTKLELRRYSKISTLSTNAYLERIDEFNKVYLTPGTNQSNVAYSIFFKMLDWSFNKMSKGERQIIKHDSREELIRKAIFIHAETEPVYFHNLSLLAYFLNTSELAKVIQTNQHISAFNLEILSESHARWTFDQELFELTLPKIADTVTLQIIQGQKPSYKILLQQIVVGLILKYKLDDVSIKLSSRQNNNENDRYKAAILLLQKDFGKHDLQLFEQILTVDTTAFLDKRYVKVLLYVLQFSVKNEIIDHVFKFLERKIIDEKDKSELYTQIKNYIECQKSGVQNLVE